MRAVEWSPKGAATACWPRQQPHCLGLTYACSYTQRLVIGSECEGIDLELTPFGCAPYLGSTESWTDLSFTNKAA